MAVPLALVVPFLVTLALVPLRDSVTNTNAALVLVLVIVAAAASGNRAAGLLAALSSAAWFDFFLTRPYQTFTITRRNDVETTILLLAVGVGVTEIALWGRRQQERADQEAAYLADIRSTAEATALRSAGNELVSVVSDQLTQLLGLRESRFQYGAAGLGGPARLRRDGEVEWHRKVWDVQHDGLPVGTDIELLVQNHGRLLGRFLLAAAPDSRPTLAQRLVAVTLAHQVGSLLTTR